MCLVVIRCVDVMFVLVYFFRFVALEILVMYGGGSL